MHNIPYTIHHLRYDDWVLQKMGDDILFIGFDLSIGEDWYWQSVELDQLIDWGAAHDRPEAAYLQRIRNGITGFGPKHSVILKYMEDEDFDIEPLVRAFLDHHFHEKGMEFVRHRRRPGLNDSPEEQEAQRRQQQSAAEMLALMDAHFPPDAKEHGQRHTQFLDDMMDLLNRAIIERFPEILEGKPDHILRLQDILIDVTLSLGEKLDKLVMNIEKEAGE